ncbi:MAG: aspartate aminotransferase family protein [bacterium]|jgi:glutamate-1-semialdehyde 2,1-aminomutase|nr:aspartate aminotransferase family protein [Planctomycetota bacterium]HIL50765.1 aspartate aminotransferase family protein [Planctomycetota bacterium]
MARNTSNKSAELFARAQAWLPGGVSRNTLLRKPHPIYVERGEGCRVVDVDGTEYLDFANNMASLIHGHAHPSIVEAVTDQLQRGSAFSMATEIEVRYAEELCARSPNFERIRFVNSGTEAVMAGLKAARAYTGRPKVAKVEGSYHGAYDYAEVSQAPVPETWGEADTPASVPLAHGTPESVLSDVIVLPFNEPEKAVARLDAHAGEIACVLLDPIPHRVGLVAAHESFVSRLRRWTEEHNALLMFDEVISFRTQFGGLQERHTAKPDLTALGKIIGGGFPAGALAGSEEVMSVFQSKGSGPLLPHSGTFSANPVTMSAGRMAMELYDREAVERINRLGDRARALILEAIAEADVPASVTGEGSMLRLHMKQPTPFNYRSAYDTPNQAMALQQFLAGLKNEGILCVQTGTAMLSTVMGEAEIDRLAQAILTSLGGIDRALLG